MTTHLRLSTFTSLLVLLTAATGCTEALDGLFRYKQMLEKFSTSQEINTKIDLLWVIDNSASMDVNQKKLRDGFSGFAQRYMKPTWDIRVAVITTDTYLAHTAFQGHLNSVISGTIGYHSNYIDGVTAGAISGKTNQFQNPSWNPSLVDPVTGIFTSGLQYNELVPGWGPDWAKLLPGLHDGPITSLCAELLPYYLKGVPKCFQRDDNPTQTGASHCLTPDTANGETSVTQCINTLQNDTIHSGKAIIETTPPTGVAGDSAWTQQLVNDFMVNVSTGSSGQGSERGLGSVLQLLADNEITNSRFFREGSLRGIIFVSDEEDQTMEILSNPPAGFKPQSYYKCDLAKIQELNPSDSRVNTYCCASGCSYVSDGTQCTTKTIEGYSYRVSFCPSGQQALVPVSSVKQQLDAFFLALDGNTGVVDATGNYFTISIVPLTAQAVQDLQASRIEEDTMVGVLKGWAVDRGDRYIELGQLVGNGSLAMNLADSDYTPILDAIGRSIVEKKGTFTLTREPTGDEEMVVAVKHANGTTTTLSSTQFSVSGKTLSITDIDFILSLTSTDLLSVDYQPSNLN